MEAARTSETFENFYQTTRRYNPEDSHLHTRRHENLKFYEVNLHVRRIHLPFQKSHIEILEVSAASNGGSTTRNKHARMEKQ
jgi:hypothetical protein